MCWMTLQTGSTPVADALDAVRRHEQSNGHSWGLAVVANKEIHILKGVATIPTGAAKLLPDDADATCALGHTRLATRGAITRKNAHPFAVFNDDDEVVAALAHNGTWYDAPAGTNRCDSYYIARDLEQRYRKDPERDWTELVRATGEYVGETITVVTRTGRSLAYSGRFDITEGTQRDTATSSIAERWFGSGADTGYGYAPDGGDHHTDVESETDSDQPTEVTQIRSSGGNPIPTGEVREL